MKKVISAVMASAIVLTALSCKKETFLTLESTDSISAGADGVSTTVTLKTNAGWSASPDCDWVILHNAEGEAGICSFALSVLPNPTDAERRAAVTLRADGASAKITIIQSAAQGKSPIDIPEGFVPTLLIRHSGTEFNVPAIDFTRSNPMVDWGDGNAESYAASLKHQYSGSGEHLVTIYSDDMNAFTITDLSGVVSVEAINYKEARR